MIIFITTNRVFTDVRLNFKQLRLTAVRDLSEISRGGGGGGGNFKFGFGNEVTHPCNGSEIC